MPKQISKEEHDIRLKAAIKRNKHDINKLLEVEYLIEVCKAGEAKFIHEAVIGEAWEEKDRPEILPVKGFVTPIKAALHNRRKWNPYGGGFMYFDRAGKLTPKKDAIKELIRDGVLKPTQGVGA